MTTAALYADYRPGYGPVKHPTVGFELYPPRSTNPRAGIWQRIDRLVAAAPDYVSVTYGAGGARNQDSFNVLEHVAQRDLVPGIAHLTCIGQQRAHLEQLIAGLLRRGVRNFLAIRGDLPQASSVSAAALAQAGDFQRASELVQLIRQVAARELPDGVGRGPAGTGIRTAANPRDYVSIAVAFYPASSGSARGNDIAALLEKQRCGADYAISQVFYDPFDYESYLREATFAGVRIPLIAGIIPLTDIHRLRRLQDLTGVHVPGWLSDTLINADGRVRVSDGLHATLELCQDTLAAGAPGLHVFSFNRPRPALDVLAYIQGGGLLSPGCDRRLSANEAFDWRLLDGALSHINPVS